VSLNVVASGSWPLNYQWQREDPLSPGTWINLTESCQNFNQQVNWDYEGVYKNQLRIGSGNLGGDRGGKYRVVISNSCGSVASAPAQGHLRHRRLLPANWYLHTGPPVSLPRTRGHVLRPGHAVRHLLRQRVLPEL
jgi:hypothetical protein